MNLLCVIEKILGKLRGVIAQFSFEVTLVESILTSMDLAVSAFER